MAVSTSHAAPAGDGRPVTVIEPPRRWMPLDLHELWDQRELVYFLAWRDIKVRYKQTALGASWAILQPIFGMAVFSVFFGNLLRKVYFPRLAIPIATVLSAAVDLALAFIVLLAMMTFYGVRWDDSDIAIDWPIRDAIVSDRDAAAPRLRDVFSELASRIDRRPSRSNT